MACGPRTGRASGARPDSDSTRVLVERGAGKTAPTGGAHLSAAERKRKGAAAGLGWEKKKWAGSEGFWAAEKRMKTGWREKKRKGKENGPAGKKKKNEKESGLG